jgi:hypothetical protein
VIDRDYNAALNLASLANSHSEGVNGPGLPVELTSKGVTMKQETRMSTASRETSAPMLTYARERFVYPICTWAVWNTTHEPK